jgi:hypothetical protein
MSQSLLHLLADAAIACGAAALSALLSGASQQRTPTLVERTGTFQSSQVTESSGVAVSRQHPGVLWTHNDSGDGPMLYATDLAGRDLGRYLVPGARNEDWEDLALAPCPRAPGDCLYLADTGDNTERRRSVALYIVREPPARPRPAAPEEPARLTPPAQVLHVRYPDRAHDVEAMWVEPDGSVVLVTKGTSGPIIRYRLPAAALALDSAIAGIVDTLPIVPQRALGRLVTGAAIAPDGGEVVIRTYTELYFFRRGEGGKLLPEGPACWLGTLEPQGEAVAFLDATTLVLTSEGVLGKAGPIHKVRC